MFDVAFEQILWLCNSSRVMQDRSLGINSDGLPRTDRTFFSFSDRIAFGGAIGQTNIEYVATCGVGRVEVRLRDHGLAAYNRHQDEGALNSLAEPP